MILTFKGSTYDFIADLYFLFGLNQSNVFMLNNELNSCVIFTVDFTL